MLKSFFKITFRNIFKNWSLSIINIFGLAIGMAISVLIFLWVQDEVSYDRFFQNSDNIYRIMSYGPKYFTTGYVGTPGPLGPALKEQIPEIINYTRFYSPPQMIFRYKDNIFTETRGIMVDSSFFNIFSFPLVNGDLSTALTDPFNLVITGQMANKYFGDEDPMGKVIDIEGNQMTVSGVLQDIPSNSHIKFDYLIPISIIESTGGGFFWGSFMTFTYLHLNEKSNLENVCLRMTEIAKDNNCPQVVGDDVNFQLQHLSEIHLDSEHGSYLSFYDVGDKKYVYIFSFIAFFILLIACINYINLSTASSEKRAKEVGLKKVVGANRSQLIRQFFGESLLISFLAIDIAVLLIELFLPTFNTLTGKQLSISYFGANFIIPGLILIMIFTALFAGSYPALFLSSFKSVNVLKGTPFSPGNKGGLRRALVVFQFTLSIILIIGTSVIFKQLFYLKNKELGFDRDNIIHLPLKGEIAGNYDIVKLKLLENPNIIDVTVQDYLWATNNNRCAGCFDFEGKDPEADIDMLIPRVGYDFFKTYKIDIIEGRSFSPEFPSDSTRAYILNEEAVKITGIESPLGKYFKIGDQEGLIIGVCKNIHYRSLHIDIEPQAIRFLSDPSSYTSYGEIIVKHNGLSTSETLKYIENVFQDTDDNTPFEYNYLDKTYENLYKTEGKVGSIINYFTFITIFISCLGLYGLASFITEKRTKEIGVRKVTGASVSNIVFLLSKDFSKWILIAFVLASIVAWPIMNKWLQNFTNQTHFSWLIFAFAAILTLFVVLLTISFHTIKTARQNPVNSLRYE